MGNEFTPSMDGYSDNAEDFANQSPEGKAALEDPGTDPQDGKTQASALEPSESDPAPKADPEPAVRTNPDDRRREIYAKSKENRTQDLGENDQMSPSSQRLAYIMELESQGLNEDEIAQALVEQYGDEATNPLAHEEPADDPDPEPSAAPASQSPEHVDNTAPEYVKIEVDGEEQWATYDEVEKAGGVEQLQKDRTADARFRAAKALSVFNEQQAEQLARERQELERLRANPPTPPPGGSQTQVLEEDLERRAEALTEDLISGDEERTKEAVKKLLSGEARPQPTTAEPEPTQPSQPPQQQPGQGGLSQEQIQANAYFAAKFEDLAADKTLTARVSGYLSQERMLSPEKSLVDIVQEAGDYVRRTYVGPKGTDGNRVLTAEEISRRRTRSKQSMSQATPANAQRQPASTRQRPMTESERRSAAVQQIKRGRGQSA